MASEQGEDRVVRGDIQSDMRDTSDSEVWSVPPGGLPTRARDAEGQGRMTAGFGEEGSNAGEIDPGVAGNGEMFESAGTIAE